MSDPRITRALDRLHADVAHDWSLVELATVAGMSRSAFAATFQTLVGVAPKAYLSERRMALARQAFLAGDHGLGAIAAASGFRSFSGFSTAFRNATGVPPSRYGKEVAPP